MKAIVTVTGLDHKGIIATVASTIAKNNVNIINLSQTLMNGYFTMMMQVEFDENTVSIGQLQEEMKMIEEEQALIIRIQSEEIFRAMHEI